MISSGIDQCAIFTSLDEKAREKLAQQCTIKHYAKQAVLIKVGEIVSNFSIVASGLLQYQLLGGNKYDLLHGFSGPGDFGASMEVFLQTPMLCRCSAFEDTSLIVIPGKVFMDLLDTQVGLAKALAELHMRERMMIMKSYALHLSQNSELKIGYTLLYLCQAAGRHVDGLEGAKKSEVAVTQEKLASMIGLSRQTLAVTVKAWKKQGFLVVKRNSLVILDLPAFTQYLEIQSSNT